MRLHPLHYGGWLNEDFVSKGVSVVGTANAGGRMSGLLNLASVIRSARSLVHFFLPEAYLFGASLGLVFGARSEVSAAAAPITPSRATRSLSGSSGGCIGAWMPRSAIRGWSSSTCLTKARCPSACASSITASMPGASPPRSRWPILTLSRSGIGIGEIWEPINF